MKPYDPTQDLDRGLDTPDYGASLEGKPEPFDRRAFAIICLCILAIVTIIALIL